MSRITAYEATDGTLFKDKEAYRKHQAALNLLGGVAKIANTFSGNDVLNKEVAEFIVANGEQIKAALNGKEVSVASVAEVPAGVEAPILEDGAADTAALGYPATGTVAPVDGVDALVAELGVAA